MLQDEALQNVLSNCAVSVDPVTNRANVFYKDMKDVSSNINLLAFIRRGSCEYRAGFVADNWVYCEKFEIGTGGGSNISASFDSSDVNRSTVSGGVKEYTEHFSFSDKELEALFSAQNPIMRFSNEDESNSLDHTLTQDELDCLKQITFLWNAHRTIDNTLFTIQNSLCN